MSKKKLPKGLEVVVKKQKGRGDSFWYEGLMATYRGYKIIAVGDIDIGANVKVPHSCKWEDIADEVENDKGLHKLVGGNIGTPDGKLTRKYFWINNNWFELIPPDDDGARANAYAYDYDEAISMLIMAGDEAPGEDEE